MGQVSSFRIGENLFAIDIMCIKEISKIHKITPVPEAPKHVLGLMNLRGQIVSVIHPLLLWQEDDDTTIENCRLLILKTGEQAASLIEQGLLEDIDLGQDFLGFVIKEVGNVIEYEKNEVLEPPPHLGIKDIISGVLPRKDEVIAILDLKKFLKKTIINNENSE